MLGGSGARSDTTCGGPNGAGHGHRGAPVDSAAMSLLGRLFGSRPAPPPAPAVEVAAAPNTVVIPADLAERLTAGGAALGEAVEATLRTALANVERPGEALPFWLVRDQQRSGEMEQELRDRVAQRRAGEGDH